MIDLMLLYVACFSAIRDETQVDSLTIQVYACWRVQVYLWSACASPAVAGFILLAHWGTMPQMCTPRRPLS